MENEKNFYHPIVPGTEEAINMLIDAVRIGKEPIDTSSDFMVITTKEGHADIMAFGDFTKLAAGVAVYLHENPEFAKAVSHSLKQLQLELRQN